MYFTFKNKTYNIADLSSISISNETIEIEVDCYDRCAPNGSSIRTLTTRAEVLLYIWKYHSDKIVFLSDDLVIKLFDIVESMLPTWDKYDTKYRLDNLLTVMNERCIWDITATHNSNFIGLINVDKIVKVFKWMQDNDIKTDKEEYGKLGLILASKFKLNETRLFPVLCSYASYEKETSSKYYNSWKHIVDAQSINETEHPEIYLSDDYVKTIAFELLTTECTRSERLVNATDYYLKDNAEVVFGILREAFRRNIIDIKTIEDLIIENKSSDTPITVAGIKSDHTYVSTVIVQYLRVLGRITDEVRVSVNDVLPFINNIALTTSGNVNKSLYFSYLETYLSNIATSVRDSLVVAQNVFETYVKPLFNRLNYTVFKYCLRHTKGALDTEDSVVVNGLEAIIKQIHHIRETSKHPLFDLISNDEEYAELISDLLYYAIAYKRKDTTLGIVYDLLLGFTMYLDKEVVNRFIPSNKTFELVLKALSDSNIRNRTLYAIFNDRHAPYYYNYRNNRDGRNAKRTMGLNYGDILSMVDASQDIRNEVKEMFFRIAIVDKLGEYNE